MIAVVLRGGIWANNTQLSLAAYNYVLGRLLVNKLDIDYWFPTTTPLGNVIVKVRFYGQHKSGGSPLLVGDIVIDLH